MATTCTPNGLLGEYPCFSCLSQTEMLAVFILIANELLGTYTLPAEVDTLLEDSACFNCISDKQKFQAIISTMAQVAYARSEKSMDDIRDEIKCLLCAPPGLLKAAAVLMLCQLTDGITPPQ